MSYYPNPASAGTPIEFELPASSETNRTISVTSLNGVRVFSQSVQPGVNNVSIPTAQLSSGTYLFTLTENGRTTETANIIIR